jgi:O-antigen/teichoic acid export membrane protein
MRAGFWRLSSIGVSVLFGFCTLLLVARTLGPELFGQYAFALWLASAAAPVTGACMSALTSRTIANIQSRAEPEIAAGIFYFVARQRRRRLALYCLLYLLLLVACAKFFGNIPLVPLLLAGFFTLIQMSGGIVAIALRGLRRFDLLAAIHLLGAATTLLLALLSAQTVTSGINQMYLFLLAPAVASMLTVWISALCAGKLLPLKQARKPGMELQEQLARGLRSSLLPVILDVIVWQHAELIAFVGRARSTADLGYYLLGVMISGRVMQALPTLYTTCILPLRLRLLPDRRSTNAADAYRRTTFGLAWLAMPVCAFGVAFCPNLISWYFGAAYLPAVMPLRILLVATALGSISSASVTRLANEERKRAQVWLSAAGAMLTLALAWPLSASAGMMGVAIASAIAQCVCATGTMVICIRKMRSQKAS